MYNIIRTNTKFCIDVEVNQEKNTFTLYVDRQDDYKEPLYKFKLQEMWLSKEEALKLFTSLKELLEKDDIIK